MLDELSRGPVPLKTCLDTAAARSTARQISTAGHYAYKLLAMSWCWIFKNDEWAPALVCWNMCRLVTTALKDLFPKPLMLKNLGDTFTPISKFPQQTQILHLHLVCLSRDEKESLSERIGKLALFKPHGMTGRALSKRLIVQQVAPIHGSVHNRHITAQPTVQSGQGTVLRARAPGCLGLSHESPLPEARAPTG